MDWGPDPWPAVPGPDRGVSVAVDFTQTPEGPTDVVVRALFDHLAVELAANEGKRLGVECVRVQRRDGSPLSSRDLTRLGLGRVHRALERLLAGGLAAEYLGENWGAPKVPRPGRRGRDDLHYALVADAYVHALEVEARAPVAYLVQVAEASGEHATADEIRAKVRRARERGLLTPAPPGRAGGELTAKAVQILSGPTQGGRSWRT